MSSSVYFNPFNPTSKSHSAVLLNQYELWALRALYLVLLVPLEVCLKSYSPSFATPLINNIPVQLLSKAMCMCLDSEAQNKDKSLAYVATVSY